MTFSEVLKKRTTEESRHAIGLINGLLAKGDFALDPVLIGVIAGYCFQNGVKFAMSQMMKDCDKDNLMVGRRGKYVLENNFPKSS